MRNRRCRASELRFARHDRVRQTRARVNSKRFRCRRCSEKSGASRGEFSCPKPGAEVFTEGGTRAHSAGTPFQENAEFVIDLEQPETETVRVLAREPMSKSRRRADFEVIENDHRADRRLVHREKKSVFPLRRVRWAVDQNQSCLLQTQKRFALRENVKRLDRPETIPASRQG